MKNGKIQDLTLDPHGLQLLKELNHSEQYRKIACDLVNAVLTWLHSSHKILLYLQSNPTALRITVAGEFSNKWDKVSKQLEGT